MSDYETDLSAWAKHQATLLRRIASGDRVSDAQLDWLNITEELEAVGRSERRELRNRMERLLQHLLKWQFQPEHHSRSWRSTIKTERRGIKKVLDDNPSLLRTLPLLVESAYPAARIEAMEETGLLKLPEISLFDWEQALDGELPA